MMSETRGIDGCKVEKSSIFLMLRNEKCECQMRGCVAEQKVSDWQMNACRMTNDQY